MGLLPLPQRESKADWPTLIVEVGFSQSLQSLRSVENWWFTASHHEVKIVLLVKLRRENQTIQIEKRVAERQSAHRLSATTTRAFSAAALPLVLVPVPVLRQTIMIARDNSTDPATYEIQGGNLVLEFELLFLRPPNLEQGEGDVILIQHRLEQLAKRVWRL